MLCTSLKPILRASATTGSVSSSWYRY